MHNQWEEEYDKLYKQFTNLQELHDNQKKIIAQLQNENQELKLKILKLEKEQEQDEPWGAQGLGPDD